MSYFNSESVKVLNAYLAQKNLPKFSNYVRSEGDAKDERIREANKALKHHGKKTIDFKAAKQVTF